MQTTTSPSLASARSALSTVERASVTPYLIRGPSCSPRHIGEGLGVRLRLALAWLGLESDLTRGELPGALLAMLGLLMMGSELEGEWGWKQVAVNVAGLAIFATVTHRYWWPVIIHRAKQIIGR